MSKFIEESQGWYIRLKNKNKAMLKEVYLRARILCIKNFNKAVKENSPEEMQEWRTQMEKLEILYKTQLGKDKEFESFCCEIKKIGERIKKNKIKQSGISG